MDACRQAVLDIRCCLDWLQQQGYERLGTVGTSLGSCYAFLAAAHDSRIQVAAFNHASTYVADVVWHGQSTRHIRQGMEPRMDIDRLRELWKAVSPMSYFKQFARWPRKSLIVYAKYDLTFLPEFSKQVVAEFKRHNLDHKVAALACGHYSMGETPYKYIDGWALASFLGRAFKKQPLE
jgi:dienelactone hydrolase